MTDQTRAITPFITRWRASAAAERANYQLFLIELCDLLGVDRPGVATAYSRPSPHRPADARPHTCLDDPAHAYVTTGRGEGGYTAQSGPA